jgi:hypothetical protein
VTGNPSAFSASPRLRIGPQRRRLCALAALVLTFFLRATAQTDSDAKALCAQAGAISRELTEISGMKLRHPVPCDFITKEKINAFLKKRVKEVAKPEEIRAEELTLKKFGLVPQDFDLSATTVDLLTEQAAAFYDYDRKKLFITDSTPSATQEPVLAHELSHALADQNFHLGKYIRQGRKSDDGSAARLAVMEGQATWLMSEFLARKLGQSLKKTPELAAAMSGFSEAAGGQYPVFDNSPLYLRRTLVFPYVQGMLFQNALVRRDGDAGFAEVFRRPPVSTQQIAHPEKYFASESPTSPALPEVRLPRGYKSLVGGTLGELDHSVLIEQFAGKQAAAEMAPHWRGSTFEIRENKKERRTVLLYAVEWESEEAARRYFAFYKEALGKKWKKIAIDAESADSAAGTGDDGRFELRCKGAIVTSVEGLPPKIH